MPLGLPSSIKYVDRSKRPKRIFIKREDGTLEEVFRIHTVDPRQGQSPAEERALRWDQDAD